MSLTTKCATNVECALLSASVVLVALDLPEFEGLQ